MDLIRSVTYRGYALNTIQFDTTTRDMVGCEVTRVEMGVDGVGYEEKRAMGDGFDSADTYLGKRIIAMTGNLYGRTRPEAFDKYLRFMDIMNPSDAFESNRTLLGYVPLDFYIPTLDTSKWPSNLIHQMVLARPAGLPSVVFASDAHGGRDDQALSIPWSVRLECRDPRVYSYDLHRFPLGTTLSGSGVLTNLGQRPAPIYLRLETNSATYGSGAGPVYFTLTISTLTGTVTNVVRIEMPKLSTWQYFEYHSTDRLLRMHKSNYKQPRMDLLTFPTGSHPVIPPGQVNYSWTLTGAGGTKLLVAPGTKSYMDIRDVW